MTIRVVNQGRAIINEAFVNKTAPQNLVLCLFQNNITPADTDVTATYTEATFTGYANVTLTGASWGAATVANPSVIAYAQQTFASTANQSLQTIYGYFVKQFTSGLLVFSERDPAAPFNLANNGDTYKVTPQFQMS